ncbi:MAG: GTP cyclohydrolase II [Paludibacterium sp.]|uniref:GTP cyclohydrolase II n=1 Tax=Paludibacterium sp. TaxID=1917523 RepID=UPI0025FB7642|nr:GTP cyclohydrolase II [Paludibacterium sp.]MBV8047573.1 GTP cyclohydrolase II [Paludibacterium sp.]MBV8646328.1 GTP cyclohydrolase II [Paludibacterium sp.]
MSQEVGSAVVQLVASCQLPTQWGVFTLHGFAGDGNKEHVMLTMGSFNDDEPVLIRLHSECLTGDALFSLKCDCGFQLEAALAAIAEAGRGALLYLRQEGRGIGLINKIRAYKLQDQGADTVEANEQLGFPADMRDFGLVRDMLSAVGIRRVRVMTNNPQKIETLAALGVEVVERVPLLVGQNPHNDRYMKTKADKMGHLLP